MGVRFHVDIDHRVLCVRFVGDIPGLYGLALLRQHHEANPSGLNYDQIFDVRKWAGSVADQDLVDHFQWVRAFRQKHCLEIQLLPINVYLASEGTGAATIVDQLTALRGANVLWAQTVPEAWQYCSPGKPLPAAVHRFFMAW